MNKEREPLSGLAKALAIILGGVVLTFALAALVAAFKVLQLALGWTP